VEGDQLFEILEEKNSTGNRLSAKNIRKEGKKKEKK